MAGLAVRVGLDRGIAVDPRIACFGVGVAPVLAKAAMAALAGKTLTAETIPEIAAALDGDLDPPTDLHGGPALKRRWSRVLLERALRRIGGIAEAERGMSLDIDITLTVNGERVSRRVEARRHLVDFLRLDVGLTGTHTGCEHGACGACTVRLDGQIVRGCLVLAARPTAHGRDHRGRLRHRRDPRLCRRRSSPATRRSAATARRACC